MSQVLESKTPRTFASARVAVTICFSIAVLEGFDIQAVGVTAAKIAPALHLARDQMGWVFAASNLGLVFGASVGGWLADRFGRKPVLAGAVIVFALFTLGTALANAYGWMLAARILTGLGLGAAIPNMIAIASDISSPRGRAVTTSLMFCGMPVGGALAALLTASLPADFDYRLVFVIGGILPLLISPVVLMALPETRPAPSGARVSGQTIPNALFGDGRIPATMLLWTAFVPTSLILYLMLNWLPILVTGRGLPASAGPQAALAFNIGGVIGALILGRIVDQVGPRWSLGLAFAGLVAAMLALAYTHPFIAIMACCALIGGLVIGSQYALYSLAPRLYPSAFRATGAGAAVALSRVGSIIGPLLGGILPQGQVLPALAPLAILAGLAVVALTFVARFHDD